MKLAHTYIDSTYSLKFLITKHPCSYYIKSRFTKLTYFEKLEVNSFYKHYCEPYPRFTKEMNQWDYLNKGLNTLPVKSQQYW